MFALYVFSFVVSVLITVLLVRFLWMVPNELRDISRKLNTVYVYLINNDLNIDN